MNFWCKCFGTWPRFSVESCFLRAIVLAHKHPHRSTADLLDLVFDIALEKLNPAKPPSRKSPTKTVLKTQAISRPNENVGASGKVGASEPSGASGNVRASRNVRVPRAELKRSVWVKAQNRCESGGSTYMLEIDHIKPFALGGITSTDNLRLLCRNCNQRESIKTFGAREYAKRASLFDSQTDDRKWQEALSRPEKARDVGNDAR